MRRRNGFTLIELLVVITIMVIMAGLLIPGVLRAMKQAKTNRALSEMQHLATVITQVYSEVGYYVRLEDLTKTDTSTIFIWTSTNDYTVNGQSDDEITVTALDDSSVSTGNMWNGPYLTYKNYVSLPTPYGPRPIDPWGNPTGDDTVKSLRQYRMFWIDKATSPAALFVPAGANGAMVIISAGGDGVYQCGITAGTTPAAATQADFDDFNPAVNKGDDAYYIFNAGIQ